MSSYIYPERSSLIRYVMSHLIVRHLQSVLKAEGLPTSGLKAPLQKRLTTYIEELVSKGDTESLDRVKGLIYRPESPAPSRTPSNSTSTTFNSPSTYAPPSLPMAQGTQYPAPPAPAPAPPAPPPPQYASSNTNLTRIHFKESPFYSVLVGLTSLEFCPVMTANRHSVQVSITLNPQQAQQINADKSYRCMVYCAAIDGIAAYTRDTEIAFPHQVELRVNEVQISGLNLRGLKNKPGSTRPADITDYLTKKPNHRNHLILTYALTQKKFAFIVNYVKTDSVEELVEKLRNGASISKDTVILNLVKKNEDSDLVTTSSIMSLKCPLSTLRIDLPIRSTFCNHIQCFDATSFLQLQQQAPTWSCPTCNKSINWRALVVDQYFHDILNKTPKTVDSVTIDVDGRWSVATESCGTPMADSDSENGGERDDIIEVSGGRLSKLKVEAMPSSSSPIASSSRERSASVSRSSTSTKRPASQVIDLTLSDDEEPPRPAKRTNSSFLTPSSVISDGRNGGFTGFDMQVFNGAGRSPVGTPDPFPTPRYGR